jgi:uncharacterized protein
MRGGRFDWDDANVEHIALHGLEPEDVEEAYLDPRRVPAEAYNTPTERRRAFVGVTDAGRLLRVVYTLRRGMIRVVSAFDAPPQDRRRYGRGRR